MTSHKKVIYNRLYCERMNKIYKNTKGIHN